MFFLSKIRHSVARKILWEPPQKSRLARTRNTPPAKHSTKGPLRPSPGAQLVTLYVAGLQNSRLWRPLQARPHQCHDLSFPQHNTPHTSELPEAS